MADRLRLFVALELPAPARDALAAFRDRADPELWRPVRDESLHLTLAFLGHRPEGDVETVRGVLEACAGEPRIPLVLGAGLLLPPRRARVLCADVDDVSGELAALQSRVSDGLVAAGMHESERRPFRAHATVARLRAGARAPRPLEDGGPERVAFAGGPLTLFRSRLGRGGAAYEPLVRIELRS
jgi:RNA 2',3'-cyclic 3'-phosphodiesterase